MYDENPATSLLHRILEEARSLRATAIHIEPDDDGSIRVRFRVEGALLDGTSFTRKFHSAIVARVKKMAGMEVAERRRTQSGAIRFSPDFLDVEYAVTTRPGEHGEALYLTVRSRDEPLAASPP